MWLETGMRFFGEGFSQMSDIMLTLRFSGLWPDHISGQVSLRSHSVFKQIRIEVRYVV